MPLSKHIFTGERDREEFTLKPETVLDSFHAKNFFSCKNNSNNCF